MEIQRIYTGTVQALKKKWSTYIARFHTYMKAIVMKTVECLCKDRLWIYNISTLQFRGKGELFNIMLEPFLIHLKKIRKKT